MFTWCWKIFTWRRGFSSLFRELNSFRPVASLIAKKLKSTARAKFAGKGFIHSQGWLDNTWGPYGWMLKELAYIWVDSFKTIPVSKCSQKKKKHQSNMAVSHRIVCWWCMPNIKDGRNEWGKKPDSVDLMFWADFVEIILFCDLSNKWYACKLFLIKALVFWKY